jgi:hypothetical protein
MAMRLRVALALALIAAAACGDPDATAPQRTAPQRASKDIDPTKNPPPPPVISLSVSPSSLTFGPQAPNTSSAPQVVTVRNTSVENVAISVNQISITGPFTQTSNCQGTILAQDSTCTISVVYAPTTGGTQTGWSLMVSSSAQNSPNWVVLNGTPTPWINVTPTAIGFGSVALGNATSGRVVKITNTGTAPFVVYSLTPGGTNPGDFPIYTDGCTGASLSPGGSCTAYVSFEPLGIGTRTATITIAHNASGGPKVVSLSGTGVKSSGGGGGYIP